MDVREEMDLWYEDRYSLLAYLFIWIWENLLYIKENKKYEYYVYPCTLDKVELGLFLKKILKVFSCKKLHKKYLEIYIFSSKRHFLCQILLITSSVLENIAIF